MQLGAPAQSPKLRLERGLQAFEYGDYATAVAILRPVVEEDLVRGADRIQALRALGVALFALGRRGGAEAAFLLLLQEDPDARLDPALVAPDAIAFFDEVRARHRAVLDRVARAKRPSPWLNLIPPLGQFQNRERLKGVVLLSLEATFLAVNLGSYFSARSMRRSDGTVESEGRFQAARTTNIVSFCLLVGTVVYGIADGFYVHAARERAAAGLAVAPFHGGAMLLGHARF